MKFRKRVQYNIEGTPISQVANEINAGLLKPNDLFLVSQPDHIADSLGNNSFKSQAMSYEDFEKALSADVMAALGLGSMAYENPSAYSKAKHFHPQYSHIGMKTYCSNRKQNVLCSLVTFEADGISENISIPAVKTTEYKELSSLQLAPRIGEMRMFAVKDSKSLIAANHLDTKLDSKNFSGWAFPDGSFIDKDRFPRAYEVFGDHLPIIDNYMFKLNPFTENVGDGENAAGILSESKIPIENHQHKVSQGSVKYESSSGKIPNVNFKYTYQYKAAIDTTYDWSMASTDNCTNALEYGYKWCGCTNKTLINAQLGLKQTIDSNTDAKIGNSASSLANQTTLPSRTELLTLVYIGKPYSEESKATASSEESIVKRDDEYDEYSPTKGI